jgi:hypothetical protein
MATTVDFVVQFLHVKISQLFNKMCSHCLFPAVDKSETSGHATVGYVDQVNRFSTNCSNLHILILSAQCSFTYLFLVHES